MKTIRKVFAQAWERTGYFMHYVGHEVAHMLYFAAAAYEAHGFYSVMAGVLFIYTLVGFLQSGIEEA